MELESTDEFISILYDYDKMIELIDKYNLSDNPLGLKCPDASIYIDESYISIHDIVIDIIFIGIDKCELQLLYSSELEVLTVYINANQPYKVLDNDTYPKYIKSFIIEMIDELQTKMNIMNKFIQQPKRVN